MGSSSSLLSNRRADAEAITPLKNTEREREREREREGGERERGGGRREIVCDNGIETGRERERERKKERERERKR